MTDSFAEPEVFSPRPDLNKTQMRKQLVLFVPMVFLMWVLVSALLYANGVNNQYFIGAFPTAALAFLLYWGRNKLMRSAMKKMALRLDPAGITQSDQVHERFVAWNDLRSAGKVIPFVGLSTGQTGGRNAQNSRTPVVDMLSRTATGHEFGLTGVGKIEILPTADSVSRTTLEQNFGKNGIDAQTGQPLVALYPQQYQADWLNDRIGQWLQHYRSDLYVQGKEYATGAKA